MKVILAFIGFCILTFVVLVIAVLILIKRDKDLFMDDQEKTEL
jgi:hypothetical protein